MWFTTSKRLLMFSLKVVDICLISYCGWLWGFFGFLVCLFFALAWLRTGTWAACLWSHLCFYNWIPWSPCTNNIVSLISVSSMWWCLCLKALFWLFCINNKEVTGLFSGFRSSSLNHTVQQHFLHYFQLWHSRLQPQATHLACMFDSFWIELDIKFINLPLFYSSGWSINLDKCHVKGFPQSLIDAIH